MVVEDIIVYVKYLAMGEILVEDGIAILELGGEGVVATP